MNRNRILGSLASLALVLGVAGPAAAAPVPCYGAAIILSQSNLEVRLADGTTFVDFDFTGTHTLCLSDGSSVEGTIAGHLRQATTSKGLLSLHFAEILAYGDGTIAFVGDATANGSVWKSAVRSVGAGTGSLFGISGQGRFYPTSATSFADLIFYTYGGG